MQQQIQLQDILSVIEETILAAQPELDLRHSQLKIKINPSNSIQFKCICPMILIHRLALPHVILSIHCRLPQFSRSIHITRGTHDL